MRNLVAMLMCLALVGAACGDGDKKRPIGATCGSAEQCASGLCVDTRCIDPQGDEDEDGVANAIEIGLGTNPLEADSDHDGIGDRDELDDQFANRDSDGDGKPDALESTLLDADHDCVADELDPHDADPGEGADVPAVASVCPHAGVCAAAGASLAVRCPSDLASPVCELSGVPGYAAVDDDCDGEDDDCDGTPDDAGTCTSYPSSCEDIVSRSDGLYTIDPDGAGSIEPFEVECLFTCERGDWVRYTPKVMEAIAALDPDGLREYLLKKGGAWYRSPLTLVPWRWDAGAPVAGLWLSQNGNGVLGGFDCYHTEALPPIGVGCMSADQGPTLEVTAGDAAAATATVCTTAGGGASPECQTDIAVYVRMAQCEPDEGQLLEDGGFSRFETDDSCWFAFGDGVPLKYFSFDQDDVPSGGTAPSLRSDNPTLGNDIYALEVGQTHLSLLAGRAYIWRFSAMAAQPRTIRPFLQSRDLTVHLYNEDTAIGTTWERHQIAFIAPGSTYDGMLSFQLAEVSTAAVWLDDVELIDYGYACTPAPDMVLVDGDFQLPSLFCWEVFAYNGIATEAHYDLDDYPGGGVAPSLRVSHTPGTQVPSDAGIIQRNLVIPAYHDMTLAFWLKASAPTSVGYGLGNGQGYPGGFVTAGTTWQRFTFNFYSGDGNLSGEGSLQFQFGNPDANTVWIDDIEIIDHGEVLR